MGLNIWQKATGNLDKKHPGCIGRECGTWELCDNGETKVLIYGCIYYDEEAENQMINDEIEAGV